MMIVVRVAAGLLLGAAAGFYAGYDLGHSSSRFAAGKLGFKVVFGMLRRLAVITAGLFAGLALGGYALAGAAAGVVGGFAVAVALRVRA